MNKKQKKGIVAENEQKIGKRNNNNYCWKCTKDRKEEE
jgi:hypothetical protein